MSCDPCSVQYTECALSLALQCVAVRCCALPCIAVRCSVLQCVAVRCSVLQCVAVCCSVLQCVAVCCSVSVDNSTHVFSAKQFSWEDHHQNCVTAVNEMCKDTNYHRQSFLSFLNRFCAFLFFWQSNFVVTRQATKRAARTYYICTRIYICTWHVSRVYVLHAWIHVRVGLDRFMYLWV